MRSKAQEILSVLRESEGHMTADELYRACREAGLDVSVATVYRNLGILVEKGLVKKFSVAGEPEYYDKTVTDHEHLFCSRCHRVADAKIADVQALLEQTFGITLESYDLSMRVICTDCKKKGA